MVRIAVRYDSIERRQAMCASIRLARSTTLALVVVLVVGGVARAADDPPAIARTGAGATALSGTSRFALGPTGPTPDPTSSCAVTVDHRAAPEVLKVGEAATATVRIAAPCTAIEVPLHVVLVVDAGHGAGGRALRELAEVVRALASVILVAHEPGNRVGLVGWGGRARIFCEPTDDEVSAAACARRLGALRRRGAQDDDPRWMERAVADGMAMLRSGREGRAGGGIYEVMIVFSAGPEDEDCPALLDAVRRVKGEGVLAMTVCMGRDYRRSCMARAASSPRYHFDLGDVAALQSVFQRIRAEYIHARLRALTLRYLPAEGMRYVPDSAVPAPAAEDAEGGLGWEWGPGGMPGEVVTVTLRLEALAPGRQPLARVVEGTFRDSLGREGSFAGPVGEVVIGGAR